MACEFDRLTLFAYLDGEARGEDALLSHDHVAACSECGAAVRRTVAALALFLRHSLPSAPAAPVPSAPTPGFTASVMARVRSEGRPAPRRPAAGTTPPVVVLPRLAPAARGRLLPLRRIAAAAGIAAAALGAVAALYLAILAPPRTGGASPTHATLEDLRGVAFLSGGRNGRPVNDVWAQRGDHVPPGEILHSPAPSTHRLSLPGRGRLNAGPSSWLAYRGESEVAVGYGSIVLAAPAATGDADAAPAYRILIPGAVVETRGEVEVTVVAPEAESRTWLAGLPLPDPAAPLPPGGPAAAALYVRAVRGDARVHLASDRGPGETLEQGQALEVVGGRPFPRAASDEPPAWSAPLREPGAGEALPAATFAAALTGRGGSAQESLRALAADGSAPPQDRALALSMLADLDTPGAVETAAAVIDDPAIPVRSAAVRVLALRTSQDRPRALAALRTRIADADPGVAVAAIRAIRALRDEEAAPLLLAAVENSAAVPTLEARVHAASALSAWGRHQHAAAIAELYPLVAEDTALDDVLRSAVSRSFAHFRPADLAGLLTHAVPGVRAAAIATLRDPEAARKMLDDPDETVRARAVEAYLAGGLDADIEPLREIVEASARLRRVLVAAVGRATETSGAPPARMPAWVLAAAEAVLVDAATPPLQIEGAARLLRREAATAALLRAYDAAESATRAVIVLRGNLPAGHMLTATMDPSPAVRRAAAEQLRNVLLPDSSEPSTDEVLATARRLRTDPATSVEALELLSGLAMARGSAEALEELLASARSGPPSLREQAVRRIGVFGDRPGIADLQLALLRDEDPTVAAAAARNFLRGQIMSTPWAVLPPPSLIEDPALPPLARGYLTLARFVAAPGEGTAAALRDALDRAGSRDRETLLSVMETRQVPPLLPPAVSVFQDADPTVRLRGLALARDDGSLEGARLLVDDPNGWVRVAALVTLVEAGDGGAETEFRSQAEALIATLQPGSPLAASLQEARAESVIDCARLALLSPWIGALASRQVTSVIARHLGILAASGDATALREATDRVTGGNRSRLLGRFASLSDVRSPAAIAAAIDGTTALDPDVRESAARALRSLLELTPSPGPAPWLAEHRLGIFDDVEVDAGAR